MKAYQDLLKHILENGTSKGDRTGTGTLSVFGHQMRFNLSEGFPMVTTKKTFWKGTVQELLWFISGSTDVTVLQSQGVQFWNSWVDEDNTIGPGYGKQMRAIEHIIPIVPKIFKKPLVIPRVQLPTTEFKFGSATGKYSFRIGDKIQTKTSGVALVAEEIKPLKGERRTTWRVVFQATGSSRVVTYRDLIDGTIKDPFLRTVFGVGYMGNFDERDPHLKELLKVWERMLRKCYGEKLGFKADTGEDGIHVSNDWHCFATFQKEVKKIPGWELKLENPKDYVLDKDILWASNRFGKDTCIWASRDERRINSKTEKMVQATNAEGITHFFKGISELAQKIGMSKSMVQNCLSGKTNEFRGWRNFAQIQVPDGHVLRYRKIDQLALVIASIKHNPDSRRHIISLWNIHDVDRMQLPPCHGNMIQFYVANGKLSCQMYQRSADVFLGLPVNIASYALLTHMIAQECGLGVGDLIITIGDAHLYTNHIEQAKECLAREPRPLPKLVLNSEIKRITDFNLEDCRLEGYDPHPLIKAPVAV